MDIFSIFRSINGEVCLSHQGSVCSFVRLIGCNLRCKYCDTKRAWDSAQGVTMSPKEVVHSLESMDCSTVTITGGEPLMQKDKLKELVYLLFGEGYNVSIETNGSLPIPDWPVSWVADWKLGGSGMSQYMDPRNFYDMGEGDFIKFVVSSIDDFYEACEVYFKLRGDEYISKAIKYAFSPTPEVIPSELLRWILTENLNNIIVSLQIHKVMGIVED